MSTEEINQPQEPLHPIHQDSDTDIRTLFISGLPPDVKEREIHNLFRLIKGYEGCKLNLKPGKAVC
jgi:RNA recognition motif-containing protein